MICRKIFSPGNLSHTPRSGEVILPRLIDHILTYTQQRNAAWDCATGNGQAAVLLAPHFRQVFATDISENQLMHAFPATNISYEVGPAESSGLASESVNLINVAQPCHWFNHVAFHEEVQRVAIPGSAIALWAYGLFQTDYLDFNQEIQRFYGEILGDFWDKERAHIENEYGSLPFPYKPLPGPRTSMEYLWNARILKGYLDSWSAVQHYIKKNATDPVAPWMQELGTLTSLPFKVQFPLFLKLGQVNSR